VTTNDAEVRELIVRDMAGCMSFLCLGPFEILSNAI